MFEKLDKVLDAAPAAAEFPVLSLLSTEVASPRVLGRARHRLRIVTRLRTTPGRVTQLMCLLDFVQRGTQFFFQ